MRWGRKAREDLRVKKWVAQEETSREGRRRRRRAEGGCAKLAPSPPRLRLTSGSAATSSPLLPPLSLSSTSRRRISHYLARVVDDPYLTRRAPRTPHRPLHTSRCPIRRSHLLPPLAHLPLPRLRLSPPDPAPHSHPLSRAHHGRHRQSCRVYSRRRDPDVKGSAPRIERRGKPNDGGPAKGISRGCEGRGTHHREGKGGKEEKARSAR